MNYKLLNLDILKDYYSKKRKFLFAGKDGFVDSVVLESHALYRILPAYHVFNYALICDIGRIFNSHYLLDADISDWKEAIDTKRIERDGKKTYLVFTDIETESIECRIDESYLKYIEDIDMYRLLIKDNKSGLFFVNDDNVVMALVLPVVNT